jgi:hypothetical protein
MITCAYTACNRPFLPGRVDQAYCSSKCRVYALGIGAGLQGHQHEPARSRRRRYTGSGATGAQPTLSPVLGLPTGSTLRAPPISLGFQEALHLTLRWAGPTMASAGSIGGGTCIGRPQVRGRNSPVLDQLITDPEQAPAVAMLSPVLLTGSETA